MQRHPQVRKSGDQEEEAAGQERAPNHLIMAELQDGGPSGAFSMSISTGETRSLRGLCAESVDRNTSKALNSDTLARNKKRTRTKLPDLFSLEP